MTDEIIEAEPIDEPAATTALAPINLFGVKSPTQVIEAATETAKPLAQLIEDRKLFTMIRDRRHVRVEGWTLLGSMLGVFPVVTWTRKLENGWEARVEAVTQAGAVVGAAEAECLRSESKWRDRDDYALRSMAQTRATSKALRLPLGFVITLAGFDPTPLEEVDGIEDDQPRRQPAADGPACPHCGSQVEFNDEKTRAAKRKPGRKDIPIWSCTNRSCGGGGRKPDGSRYSWASYEADFFEEHGEDGPLTVIRPEAGKGVQHVDPKSPEGAPF